MTANDPKAMEQVRAEPIAKTDITVDLIALRRCRFDDYLFEETVINGKTTPPVSKEIEGVDMSVDIGIWLAKEGMSAVVQLAIRVTPKQQPSWSALVDVVGKYSCGDNPVLPLDRFARNNGIAYLVPYARERLANLVSSSVFKTFVLPPTSVADLIALAKESGTMEEPKELAP